LLRMNKPGTVHSRILMIVSLSWGTMPSNEPAQLPSPAQGGYTLPASDGAGRASWKGWFVGEPSHRDFQMKRGAFFTSRKSRYRSLRRNIARMPDDLLPASVPPYPHFSEPAMHSLP